MAQTLPIKLVVIGDGELFFLLLLFLGFDSKFGFSVLLFFYTSVVLLGGYLFVYLLFFQFNCKYRCCG